VPYTLVIPAYNEERRISSLLEQLPGAGGEFIVVCEGTDLTAQLVTEFAADHPGVRIRCESRRERMGKGGAIRAGLVLARSPLVGYMDADGSTSLSQMLLLFSQLDGADAVIGSRWTEGSVLLEPQGFTRRLQSRAFNIFTRLLFDLPFKDTQCGAKVFKKAAVDAVISEMVSTGFEFDVELLWRLQSRDFRIREHPISWQNRGESRVRAGDIVRMLLGLARVRFIR